MSIPESQLETWSHQGSVTQSRNTYATIKGILDDRGSPYYLRSFESFLQGSYGNDTNIYRDSDVDVVMRLDSTWYHDARLLPAEQYAAFQRAYPGSAQYDLAQFKSEVHAWLSRHFAAVTAGTKALHIPGSNSGRRDCDVLVCALFRYYYRYTSVLDDKYVEGICFFLKDGTQVVNFPRQHGANCTAKHQATVQWFKPVVRIFKNARTHMVDRGLLRDGSAPSYFIEGLLWNAPNGKFGRSYSDTFVEVFNFLSSADRSEFRCANGIHKLLGENSSVSWPTANCDTFLAALRKLWSDWS